MAGNQALIEVIKQRIGQSPAGAIRFYDYMELCLYHPEYGYYMNGKSKIGRDGDFYTSSSIGGLMGEILARYIASQTKELGPERPLNIVEWGGGTGRLARLLLDELERTAPDLYRRVRYICVERSLHHRMLQAEECKDHIRQISWLSEAEWIEGGPWTDTIVLSNELPDAFAVHRMEFRNGEPHEIYVEWDEPSSAFRERLMRLEDPALLRVIERQQITFLEGQRWEINSGAAAWMRSIGSSLGSGQVITVDYGDETRELIAPHRMNGTFICYRSHRASDDPYAYPGEQDMTSHVDFTALAEAGETVGLRVQSYMTQKQFLVENGILDLLQDHASTDPFSPVARRNRAIRQLLLSDQMSELFKVLIQKKGELP
ncbi:class I SAM-dependent methyltransferase [Paenibacillus sp. OAS669]|uniref:class I SAM-dependent methyltransferase n=1 Tax=Paenibacillus sp. OAS669 TaxID=2663821 RepID=UPI00178BE316|nr:SAM-dependent methyltransferase [Paenibacillus sp. OAS669]MBE1443242.1 SAM-dependent MidA family methyltransferase [Paenibacillus sp. OAS669]